MYWSLKESEKIKQSIEYLDTAVLPLLPVSLKKDMEKAALMTEFIQLLGFRLERMFKGRILLFPGLTYLTSRDVYALLEEVWHWEKELEKEGFTHLFYLTSDPSWRVVEKELTGTLIWLPAFSFQKMDEGGRLSVIEEHVKQLSTLFLQKWQ